MHCLPALPGVPILLSVVYPELACHIKFQRLVLCFPFTS